MRKKITGWFIISVCLLWGFLRTGDWVGPSFILNLLAIGGFCFGIYLTKNKDE